MYKIIDFKINGDHRGSLISVEGKKNIPFDIKRVYYIFDNIEGVERGFHAHKKLQQIAVCLHGSCTFILDDGKKRVEVVLDSRSKGLYLDGFIWREMKNFSKDAVIVVFADQYYDETDYIRSYDEFKKMIEGQ